MLDRPIVVENAFNPAAFFPYGLNKGDFSKAMSDVYELMHEIDTRTVEDYWGRLEDMLPKQTLSGLLSALLGSSLAKASHSLVVNGIANGHPDLLPKGRYPADRVMNADEGIEVKTTVKAGGAVDMHGARDHWLCVFVYDPDVVFNDERPFLERQVTHFTEVYLSHVTVDMYRHNERGELGTRTATLDRDGLVRFRRNWIYKLH